MSRLVLGDTHALADRDSLSGILPVSEAFTDQISVAQVTVFDHRHEYCTTEDVTQRGKSLKMEIVADVGSIFGEIN